MNTLNQEADAVIERMKADGLISEADKKRVTAHLMKANGILGVSISATKVCCENLDQAEMEATLCHLEDALATAQDAVQDAMEALS